MSPEKRTWKTKKERFDARQQEAMDCLKEHTRKQAEKSNANVAQPEAQGAAESADEKVVARRSEKKNAPQKGEVADVSQSEGRDGSGVAEECARATLNLQKEMKQVLKKPEEFQEKIDERLYAHLKSGSDVDLSDFGKVRSLLDGISMTKKMGIETTPWNLDDEKMKVISDYLLAKRSFEVAVRENLTEVQKKLGDGSESDAEKALDVMRGLENNLMDEEIRLQENLKGDRGFFVGLKKEWDWLGDQNLATLLLDKRGHRSKDTFWGKMGRNKIGHGVLRAASLRTALMGLLVPAAGLSFGATGVVAALGFKRGLGTLSGGVAGADVGVAFARAWSEKELQKGIDELSALKTFTEKDHERVIHLKKEYDAFIQQYYSDTADAVRNGVEYQNIQGLYREAIKDFCVNAASLEDVRMKQNLDGVGARNILKRNRKVLFGVGGAALGGAISGLVAPKVFDVAADFAGDLVDGVGIPSVDAPTTSEKPIITSGRDAIPPGSLDGVDVQTMSSPPSSDEFGMTSAEGKSAPLPEPVDALENTPLSEDADTVTEEGVGGEEFLVDEQGVYTVQDGNWLSKIWLDKNGGDEGQMSDVMQALERLQGTEEGVKKLKEFGISSGDIAVIYPDDKIDTNAIQEWFDVDAKEESTNMSSIGAQGESEQVVDAANIEKQGVSAAASSGDADSEDFPLSDASASEISADTAPSLKQTLHTVSDDEHTVADVLQSRGLDTTAVPENILERQVFEGHEVQLFTTQEGNLAGVAVNEEYLPLDQQKTASSETDVSEVNEVDVGETLSFTDNLEGLVGEAEALNADMENVRDHIIIARADGEPILSVADLQQFRPSLFESDQVIASSIVKNDDAVLIQLDHPPQKRFLIETNQKGILNHAYIQEEFDTIQKTSQNTDAIHSARQGVIKKALTSLTVEKPPADVALFDSLSDRLSSKIEKDVDLTDRMFSEKGWGDKQVRVAYSENQGQLEVQERVNVNRGKRYRQAKWEWQSALVEKVTRKK